MMSLPKSCEVARPNYVFSPIIVRSPRVYLDGKQRETKWCYVVAMFDMPERLVSDGRKLAVEHSYDFKSLLPKEQ